MIVNVLTVLALGRRRRPCNWGTESQKYTTKAQRRALRKRQRQAKKAGRG